ncbi:MAG: hypothetical protein WA824_16800 [Candidatus Sulfotelmatobacter sp.]
MSIRPLALSLISVGLLFAVTSTCTAETPLEVLYVQLNTNILTYNVDPTTLQATQVGQPLSLPGYEGYAQLIAAPNDHFVYVLTGSDSTQISLSVYATDSSGVPQAPAIQSFAPAAILQFVIDPNGKFAYMVKYTTNSEGQYLYDTRLFTINASTGELTESPQVQFEYGPSNYCVPVLAGFYPNGSQIEYDIWCTPSSISATFYKRSINLQTGDLGSATEFFSYDDNDPAVNSDGILLSPRSFNDLNVTNNQTSLRIYPLTGGKTPLIDCTSAMLSACGQAYQFWQDPSGQYLLLSLSGTTEIVKIDFASKQIVDTGSGFDLAPVFSPDDLLLYGVSEGPSQYVVISGFDVNTGGLTTGEEITFDSTIWSVYPAVRN